MDKAWIDKADRIWRPAFTTEVSQQLVACLADPSGDAARQFAKLAKGAMEDAGCDLTELGRTFWIEEFVAVLPRQVFCTLREASVRDPRVRGLVENLIRQRADAASWDEPATPGEFRQDLIALLHGLDEQACKGRLPPYLPTDTDVTALSRTVLVRLKVRSNPDNPVAEGGPSGQAPGSV